MKVNGANTNNIINMYSYNKKRIEEKAAGKAKDSLEISSAGKRLSNYADGTIKGENSDEKIERIRNEISKGTYKADSRLTAQKMIDIMKGRDI